MAPPFMGRPRSLGAMPPVTIKPTSPRALGVEGGHALETVGRLFQAHVHGAHEHAVSERGEAQVQFGIQVGVVGHAYLAFFMQLIA